MAPLRPSVCWCSTVVGVMVIAILVTNTCPVRAIEEFKVGDDKGWQQPDINHTEFYSLWASKIRFHVGDSLRKFFIQNDHISNNNCNIC